MKNRGYRVVGARAVVHELDERDVVSRIRSGMIRPTTLVAAAGSDDFAAASTFPELAIYFGDAIASSADEGELSTVSRARLITYLALAGLTAALLMSLITPLCLILGVFPRFLLTTAAFGAVLALGINSALRENDTRLINISAAGFAAGGVVAWLFSSGAQFSAFHLAIIGLGGGAGLAYGLRLPFRRAVPLVIAAVVLFPMAVILNPIKPGMSVNVSVPILFAPLISLVAMAIPALPFAAFGGVLGVVLSLRTSE